MSRSMAKGHMKDCKSFVRRLRDDLFKFISRHPYMNQAPHTLAQQVTEVVVAFYSDKVRMRAPYIHGIDEALWRKLHPWASDHEVLEAFSLPPNTHFTHQYEHVLEAAHTAGYYLPVAGNEFSPPCDEDDTSDDEATGEGQTKSKDGFGKVEVKKEPTSDDFDSTSEEMPISDGEVVGAGGMKGKNKKRGDDEGSGIVEKKGKEEKREDDEGTGMVESKGKEKKWLNGEVEAAKVKIKQGDGEGDFSDDSDFFVYPEDNKSDEKDEDREPQVGKGVAMVEKRKHQTSMPTANGDVSRTPPKTLPRLCGGVLPKPTATSSPQPSPNTKAPSSCPVSRLELHTPVPQPSPLGPKAAELKSYFDNMSPLTIQQWLIGYGVEGVSLRHSLWAEVRVCSAREYRFGESWDTGDVPVWRIEL